MTVITSHPVLGQIVTDEDMAALEYITNITCEYDEKYTSFKLTFAFAENEFFTDAVCILFNSILFHISFLFTIYCCLFSSSSQELTKSYTVSPDLLDDKSPQLSDTTGSEIHWKAGKNLCVVETKKKQKAKSGKNKGQVRIDYILSL